METKAANAVGRIKHKSQNTAGWLRRRKKKPHRCRRQCLQQWHRSELRMPTQLLAAPPPSQAQALARTLAIRRCTDWLQNRRPACRVQTCEPWRGTGMFTGLTRYAIPLCMHNNPTHCGQEWLGHFSADRVSAQRSAGNGMCNQALIVRACSTMQL